MQARGAGQREGRVGARGALARGVRDAVLAAAVGAQAQELRRPPSKSKAAGRVSKITSKGGKAAKKNGSIWRMTDEEHRRFHAGFRGYCVRCDVQKNTTVYSSLASAVIPPRHAPSTMREVSSWEAKQDPVLKS